MSVPKDVVKRMKNRPYYAFLYAKNILKDRLPTKLEEIFSNDPRSGYLYAVHVLKGRLPEFVETSFVLNEYKDNDEAKSFRKKYFEKFCKNQ